MYNTQIIMYVYIAIMQSEYKQKEKYMEQLVLKQEVVDAIKKDTGLYAAVASLLGVSSYSMPRILIANDARLTQASVLKVLRDHLKIKKDADLLTEMAAA